MPCPQKKYSIKLKGKNSEKWKQDSLTPINSKYLDITFQQQQVQSGYITKHMVLWTQRAHNLKKDMKEKQLSPLERQHAGETVVHHLLKKRGNFKEEEYEKYIN